MGKAIVGIITILLLGTLYNFVPAPETCSATVLGAIYFDISEDDMCVCKSSGWKVIADGSDCT